MKKFKNLLMKLFCLSLLLFWGMGSHVNAAQSSEIPAENAETDTRPDYVIYVNRTLNCVTIKQLDETGAQTPVKSIVCSCGREGSETPEGTFQTSDYYEWRKMVDGTYGRYAVRFNRKILFHSVPYIKTSPDTLEWEEYNKLGQNASLGCVRMSVEDAKWIYDNCKPGTAVIVYSDSEAAGELGKPAAIQIDANSSCRMWDPTDTDIHNPWTAGQEEYRPFTGTIDEFNYVAYADRYPDLKSAFGYNKDALYEHYVAFGIDERRIAVSY